MRTLPLGTPKRATVHALNKATNMPLSPAPLGYLQGAAAVFMIAMSYASVPLYKLVCAVSTRGLTVS